MPGGRGLLLSSQEGALGLQLLEFLFEGVGVFKVQGV